MELEAKLKELSERIKNIKDNVQTEEATKHSFVMPFLNALGYDVFDPTVVVPEFTADIGKKKKEKVDYAILQDGKPIILIEVKNHKEELDNHHNQLVRYFTVTDAKFGILTNGIEYRFFSDLDEKNKMDKKPFLIIDLENLKDKDIKELEKFAKENLDIDNILSMANKQRYIREIQEIFKKEINNPSDEFVRFFASKILNRKLTKNIIDDFRGYIKSAFSDLIYELAAEKINALKENLKVQIEEEQVEEPKPEDEIVTTEEELEGFYIVKSILAEETDAKNITPKDTKSYFGILFKNNTRKWICRLYFNTKNKYIGLHLNEKEETKIPIERIEDIYNYKKELKEIVKRYL
ncbi:hypothetical protein SAMN06265182_0972 [Persephonella hydrogeniphila]|uniref:Restriction endonuclease type I HsdR N-terminal domain-containing protein n=1 Tax=Persephonella hydrogeniphila TaxID=198703 RepID=A0A285NFF6_9AQUI|nr:type I restriction endonuclease [Persephonella hydrogeniphila]SNZ07697.1 hypothetical protein SAMN06265182_0972 [Persephonella hydrogeniphila]